MLPRPGVDASRISPPSSRDSSRLIARPRPGAAVLAAGRAVGLLERLEDDLLLVRRDADAGVGRPRTRAPRRPGSAPRCPGSSPPSAGSTRQRHLPVVRELEGVGEQVLDDLLQPLGVGEHRLAAAAGRTGSGSRRSSPRRRAGTSARRSRCRSSSRSSPASTTTVPDSIFDRSRMSLMSISRSLPDEWIVLANSSLLGGQVAVGVLATADRRG